MNESNRTMNPESQSQCQPASATTQMHSHKLIREKDPSHAEWSLEWNESVFRLKHPDGETVLEIESAQAHRLVGIQELDNDRKLSLATPEGSLTFKRQKAAAEDLRCFVEAGLRSDPDYRQQIKAQGRRAIRLGLSMFFGGGIPFGLYCWWAVRAPPPPPGLMQSVGWLIHAVLLLLLGCAFGGANGAQWGFRQITRIRRIEEDL
jgi:hypothetical protein